MNATLHIVSTGTSLISNYTRIRKETDPAFNPNNAQDLGQLATFLEKDPRTASAEINSLDNRTGLLGTAGRRDDLVVTVLHSATDQGKRAAGVLERFLRDRVRGIQTLPFIGFDRPANPHYSETDAKADAEKSLSDLREKLAAHIAAMQAQGLAVQINCTGGFKAESAILYAVGRELKVPVYYMHESFRCCIDLPMD